MNLKSLMVDSKSAWVDFPGLDGFSVEIVNLARKELTKLRKRCTIQKFDRRLASTIDSLDEEKFVSEFTKATVKDWKGLKLKYLEELVLVDLDNVDGEKELPYSQENAESLVTSSSAFDNWLNEVVFDLDNFRGKRKDANVEEA